MLASGLPVVASGPLQLSFAPPPVQTSSYATICGWIILQLQTQKNYRSK